MTISITSLQNARVKEAVKLRERKGRERQRRLIIDGWREVASALRGGLPLDELFVCESNEDEQMELRQAAAQAGAQVAIVRADAFAKLAFGQRAEGVVATAPLPDSSLESLELPSRPLVVVLEGLEKPGNVGAVLRTADAAGASALITADPVSDLYNPNTIRASLGAVFLLPVASASATETLSWLKRHELTILAARVEAEQAYTSVDMRGGTAIVLGSETDGLTNVWRDDGVEAISVPMRGVVDSLNVSTSAAVLLFEAVRQRELAED